MQRSAPNGCGCSYVLDAYEVSSPGRACRRHVYEVSSKRLWMHGICEVGACGRACLLGAHASPLSFFEEEMHLLMQRYLQRSVVHLQSSCRVL